MIDLHCHTNISDGALSPEDLVKKAYQEGLKAIAITDHDTVTGISLAQNVAKELPIEIIPGIEISCNHPEISTEIHLVGLFINKESQILLELLEKLKKYRYNRNIKLISNLSAIDIEINDKDFSDHKYANDKTKLFRKLGKPNFAKALVNKGYAKNQMEAMKKYLDDKNGLAKTIKETITISDAIKSIQQANGIAILAHPHFIRKELDHYNNFYIFLQQLVEMGLDGIEVYYNKYKKKAIKELKRTAKNLALLLSGGSDFHNEFYRNAQLGFYGMKKRIPEELLEKMKNHLQ